MSMSTQDSAPKHAFREECTLCSFSDTDLLTTDLNMNNAILGDVILHFQNLDAALDHRYRCSRDVLRRASPYFDVLLDPTKFQEGREVQSKLNELSKVHQDTASIPDKRLPVVVIKDIGDISEKDIHRNIALRLFLKIVHDTDASQQETDAWIKKSAHALSLVTLLAIIADRFEGREKIVESVKRLDKRLSYSSKKDLGPRRKEINRRKRLLTGILLGLPDWVRTYSASLVCYGSENWLTSSVPSDAEGPERNKEPLWCRLPGGLEEELQYRRECVLETISSIPTHFVSVYTGKRLQCKLGYDTSPACDYYQLGQMIRFFAQRDLLRTQSTYTPSDECPPYVGDVRKIMEMLYQCPYYQLDINHHHCGLRTQLLPLLDTMEPLGQVAVCLKCWHSARDTESWLENPSRGAWAWSKESVVRSWETCLQHGQLKAMFTAEERRWTPPPI